MAFTTADVLTRVKDRLGITGTSQDAKLLRLMDDAHAELDLALSPVGAGWKSTTVDINIQKDVYVYTPSSIFYCVAAAHFKVGDIYVPLEYDPDILREEYNTGSPNRGVRKWCMKGNDIMLYGVPDQDVTAGLRLIVYPNATDYTSTDSVSDVMAVRLLYVIYLCKVYKEAADSKSPNVFSAQWQGMLENFVAIAQRRYNGPNLLYDMMDN